MEEGSCVLARYTFDDAATPAHDVNAIISYEIDISGATIYSGEFNQNIDAVNNNAETVTIKEPASSDVKTAAYRDEGDGDTPVNSSDDAPISIGTSEFDIP